MHIHGATVDGIVSACMTLLAMLRASHCGLGFGCSSGISGAGWCCGRYGCRGEFALDSNKPVTIIQGDSLDEL